MNAPLSTTAPLPTPAEDLVFGLTRLVDLPGLTAAAGAPLGAEDIEAIVKEAERFARERLWPDAQAADRHGAVYENGVVRVPPTYKDAYRGWVEGGWQGLPAPAESWRPGAAAIALDGGAGTRLRRGHGVQPPAPCSPPARSRRWSATRRRSRPRRGCRGSSPASGPAPCA